jgi:hypothetical protein
MTHELPARFWAKARIEDRGFGTPCVIWTGAKTADGYGHFGVERRARRVHRLAYEALVGPIPDGLVLDHLCRVTACLAVDHLEPVTLRENTVRGAGFIAQNARATHCPQGHAYDQANTYRTTDRRRDCKICRAARNRAWRARARAAKQAGGDR